MSVLAVTFLSNGCDRSTASIQTSTSPQPISVQPSQLAIGVTDLPQGWTVDDGATRSFTSPKELLGDSTDDTLYRKNGWWSAYEADFQPATGDTTRIRILIHEFTNPTGARSFFDGGVGSQRGQHGHPLANPPALGQDSYVFAQPIPEKGQTQFWFYWVDRNVVVRVLISGPDGLVAEGAATNIAQTQAAMILHK